MNFQQIIEDLKNEMDSIISYVNPAADDSDTLRVNMARIQTLNETIKLTTDYFKGQE